MALEDKIKQLKLNSEQLIKNAVSETKKEFYEKYQVKADTLDEMEREIGPLEEVKREM